jgi:hypothetical protein
MKEKRMRGVVAPRGEHAEEEHERQFEDRG